MQAASWGGARWSPRGTGEVLRPGPSPAKARAVPAGVTPLQGCLGGWAVAGAGLWPSPEAFGPRARMEGRAQWEWEAADPHFSLVAQGWCRRAEPVALGGASPARGAPLRGGCPAVLCARAKGYRRTLCPSGSRWGAVYRTALRAKVPCRRPRPGKHGRGI